MDPRKAKRKAKRARAQLRVRNLKSSPWPIEEVIIPTPKIGEVFREAGFMMRRQPLFLPTAALVAATLLGSGVAVTAVATMSGDLPVFSRSHHLMQKGGFADAGRDLVETFKNNEPKVFRSATNGFKGGASLGFLAMIVAFGAGAFDRVKDRNALQLKM